MDLDSSYECFKWRWAKARGGTRDWEDNEILEDILNDELFYAVRHARCLQDDDCLGGLICEIFGPNSIKLQSMWEWARSLGLFDCEFFKSSFFGGRAVDPFEHWERYRSLGHFNSHDEDIYTLELLWRSASKDGIRFFDQDQVPNLNLFAFAREVYRAHEDYCSSMAQGSAQVYRKHPWKAVSLCLKPSDGDQGPFEEILDKILRDQYWKEVPRLVQKGWTTLKLFLPLDLSFLQSAAPAQTMPAFSLVFAVAGSGKTQKIFDHLYANFGDYIVSGKVGKRQPTGPVQSGVLNPHRRGASLDADLIHRYRVPANSYSSDTSALEDLRFNAGRLAINRELTLEVFLSQQPTPKPAHWLLFQTVCQDDGHGFDPFARTLKLLLLVRNIHALELQGNATWGRPLTLCCFDEAQCELDADPTHGFSKLSHVLDGIYDGHNYMPRTLVLSGTSLRLEECQKTLEPFAIHDMRDPECEVTKVTDFPLVTKNKEFSSLLKSHVIRVMTSINYLSQLEPKDVENFHFVDIFVPNVSGIKKKQLFDNGVLFLKAFRGTDAGSRVENAVSYALDYFLGAKRHSWVIENSVLLRGRVRWSILYIEHLLARFLSEKRWERGQRTESQDEESAAREWIEEQSLLCQKIIETSLKARLEELATSDKEGHIHMLEDLYWTAIRADLMHRPCILRDERSGQLITEGFAILSKVDDKVGAQQKLAEPLAVKAVIEHLRARVSGYNDMLKRLLFDSQDDPSSFGKAAEYYLAWSIAGLLRSEPGVPHLAPGARAAFIDILNTAKLISPNYQIDKKGVDMTQYNLHLPECHDDVNLGTPTNFNNWLRQVRRGNYFPPLYFPSTFAGPDVVFIMKSNSGEDYVLCAIQLKTAVCCSKDDAAAVLRTIEPNLWFSQAHDQKTAFWEEYHMWKDPKQLRILTLLFTTSASCEQYWKFKLEGSGEVTGKIVLEEVLQNITETDKKLITQVQGVQTVTEVYKYLTGKLWRPSRKPTQDKSRQNSPTQDEPAQTTSAQGQTAGLGSLGKRKRAVSEPTSMPSHSRKKPRQERIGFHFAVLDKQHTALFFGKNVEKLIQVIKHRKGEEAPDKDDMLEFPDKKVQTLLGKFTVKELKTFCDFIGVECGPSMKKKVGLVNALAKIPDILERFDEFKMQRELPLRRK